MYRWFLLVVSTCALPRLFIDTDMSSDVDDVCALCMAHALADRGEVEIIGVAHNTGLPSGVGAVSVLNHFYGRDSIPIGAFKGAFGDPAVWPPFSPGHSAAGPYVDDLVKSFPSPIRNSSQVPEAVSVYRSVLAAQPASSVVIASIGFFTNLVNLLLSPPDAISPLSGKDLVKEKVSFMAVMGGQYPSSPEHEWNFGGGCAWGAPVCPVTPNATFLTMQNWPPEVPMVFSGYELGVRVRTGMRLAKAENCSSVSEGQPPNPCQQAFLDYYHWSQTYDRMSWDPLTTLFAIRGLQGYYTQTSGSNWINQTDGGNIWRNATALQSYLVLNEISGVGPIAADIDDLICAVPKYTRKK